MSYNMLVELIECVRNNTLLYDPCSKDYRNTQARKLAWDEIGRQIDATGEECKEMWTKLRNAYTNAIKRRRTKSGGQAAKHFPKWRLEDQMSFLGLSLDASTRYYGESDDETCHIAADTDSNSIRDPTAEIPDTSRRFESANSTLMAHLDKSQSTSSAFQSSPLQQAKIRKRRLIESSMREVVKLMQESTRTQTQYSPAAHINVEQNYANDETELLFLSLARSVKKLRPDEQAKVKLEITNAVFQAEFRDGQFTKPEPYSD